jgi:hypothetical protein
MVDTEVSYKGTILRVRQHPKSTGEPGQCPTGAVVWPASLALLELLERCVAPFLPSPCSLCDLSAGVGLATLALAQHGRVLSLELPCALSLLEANVGSLPGVAVRAFRWGEDAALPLGALQGAPPLALTVASDILYCAVRDGLEDALAGTLAHLAAASALGVLLVWQPRRGEEEVGVLKRAVEGSAGALCFEEPLRVKGRGLFHGVGHPEGAVFLPPSLFPEALEEEEEVVEEEKGGGAGGVLATILKRVGAPRLSLSKG